MRRLSVSIFLAVLASLLLFALAMAGIWTWTHEARVGHFEQRVAAVAADPALQDPTSSPEQLQRALERLSRGDRAVADMAVVGSGFRVLAQVGRPIPLRHYWRRLQDDDRNGAGQPAATGGADDDGRLDLRDDRGRRWVADFDLPGDRWLIVRPARGRPPGPPVGPLSGFALLLLTVGLVAWPVSRRITRRLERLQAGVERLGAGDLKARVPVEGRDEVAALARSVNASAARIEELVGTQERLLDGQRRLLANASHELRSPLARIRLALELLLPAGGAGDATAAEAMRSLGELDRLIDEILTASRLDAAASGHGAALVREPVDLAGLAAEEAARVGAETCVQGRQAADIVGEPRLLRRLLRNLLENAQRYHDPRAAEPVQVLLETDRRPLRLTVLDRGPGVREGERDKIFEPFYRIEGHAEGAGGVGLGLALARQIAQAHGGGLYCEARAGGGSAFVVTLASLESAGPERALTPSSVERR